MVMGDIIRVPLSPKIRLSIGEVAMQRTRQGRKADTASDTA